MRIVVIVIVVVVIVIFAISPHTLSAMRSAVKLVVANFWAIASKKFTTEAQKQEQIDHANAYHRVHRGNTEDTE